MDLPATYIDRFKPTGPKPRCEREELVEKFRTRLNADRAKAGYGTMGYARVAKMFEEYPTANMHQLYKECDAAKIFGGLLKYKLEEFRRPPA